MPTGSYCHSPHENFSFNEPKHLCGSILEDSWFSSDDCLYSSIITRIRTNNNNLTGIFIIGSPGSGKTHAVKRIIEATDNLYNVINLDTADLIMKEVGKSEKNLFSIFEEANKNDQCMIILENIDMVFVDTDNSAINRMKSCLLLCIESSNNLIVVATATKLGCLGEKGRLDFVIELKTPQLDDVRDMLVNFVVQFGGVELDWKEWILIYSQSLLGRNWGSIINELKQAISNSRMKLLQAGGTELKLASIISELQFNVGEQLSY